jgi:hypothetical protein
MLIESENKSPVDAYIDNKNKELGEAANPTSERNHVLQLVLVSLKWKPSKSATKSPMDDYIESKNKELGE